MNIENVSCENDSLSINPDYEKGSKILCDYEVIIEPTIIFVDETNRQINLSVIVNLTTKKDKINALKAKFTGILAVAFLTKSKKEVVVLDRIKHAILETLKDAQDFLRNSDNVPEEMFSLGYTSILETPVEYVTKEIYEALIKPHQ